MVDIGRLWHARRPRRINEQTPVLDRERHALVDAEWFPPEVFDQRIQARAVRNIVPVHIKRRNIREMRQGRAVLVHQFRRHNHGLWRHNAQRMRQRRTSLVCIDQRRHPARARHTEPDCQIFRPVRHHQRNRLALFQAERKRPARIAIGPAVILPKGECLALRDQRDLVGILRANRGHPVANGNFRRFGDRLDAVQRPQRTSEIRHFAVNFLENTHPAPALSVPQ